MTIILECSECGKSCKEILNQSKVTSDELNLIKKYLWHRYNCTEPKVYIEIYGEERGDRK